MAKQTSALTRIPPVLPVQPSKPYLAVVVPFWHGVPPLTDLLLHSTELPLQKVPHGGQVAAVDPVVVDGDGVVLERKGSDHEPATGVPGARPSWKEGTFGPMEYTKELNQLGPQPPR